MWIFSEPFENSKFTIAVNTDACGAFFYETEEDRTYALIGNKEFPICDGNEVWRICHEANEKRHETFPLESTSRFVRESRKNWGR